MARERKGDELQVEVVREEQAQEHLRELYADADQAREFFDDYIGRRQQAVNRFAEEVNGDEGLMKEFQERPLALLRERRLLGPFDNVRFDYTNFSPDLWWPHCVPICRLVPRVIVEWICIGFPPIRWCFPRLRIVWVWECRIVCF